MNQKLIAEKLNISQATVSMALKGSPRISRALSETIRKLAEDSGYHPNLAGQLLRQGRSNVIGVILPSLVNKFYAELFQTLQKLLTPRGYLLYFSQIQEKGELEQLADYLKKLRVAGIIAIGNIAGELFPMCSQDTALVFYGGDKPAEPCRQPDSAGPFSGGVGNDPLRLRAAGDGLLFWAFPLRMNSVSGGIAEL